VRCISFLTTVSLVCLFCFIHLQWHGISSSLPCFTMNTNISAWFPWTRVVMYVLHTTQGKFLAPVIRRRCSLVLCVPWNREREGERESFHIRTSYVFRHVCKPSFRSPVPFVTPYSYLLWVFSFIVASEDILIATDWHCSVPMLQSLYLQNNLASCITIQSVWWINVSTSESGVGVAQAV
jgi:hypothetical protein